MKKPEFDDTYYDLNGTLCELTRKELGFFNETVALVKETLNIDVDIFCCNHEREFAGTRSKEALGICHTSDPDDPKKDCFITIDNYFVHECYEEVYHGAYNLNFTTLEEVICHEIAHLEKWRHCKTHKRITEDLLRRVRGEKA